MQPTTVTMGCATCGERPGGAQGYMCKCHRSQALTEALREAQTILAVASEQGAFNNAWQERVDRILAVSVAA